jgi:hypothetical protein
MKKMFLLTLIVFCGMALVISPAALAGGKENGPAKQFVCHITEIDCDGELDEFGVPKAYGHVIMVSKNAVPAHCNHGDHFPSGVFGNAKLFCENPDLGLEGKALAKCVRKFAIGADCSRRLDRGDQAVLNLCGDVPDFEPLDLCPEY